VLRTILASSRFFIAIAVAGAFLAAVSLITYAAIVVVEHTWQAFSHEINDENAKTLAVDFIELIDLFLLGTVLYIVALGLYELFIDDQLPMPRWLLIRDLDDLKDKLLGVVIVLLGVTFLGKVVTWNGDQSILYFGIAISSVIAALGGFVAITRKGNNKSDVEKKRE
jgi:uncharacterized membrane protein YqhA